MKYPLRYLFILAILIMSSCTKPIKEFNLDSDAQHITLKLYSDSTFIELIDEPEDSYEYSGTWSGRLSEGSMFKTVTTNKGLQILTLTPTKEYIIKNGDAIRIEKEIFENKTIPELLTFAYHNQNSCFFDSVGELFKDSIIQNPETLLFSTEVIDTINNNINLSFYLIPNDGTIYCRRSRDVMTIFINNNNRLLVEGVVENSLNHLNNEIKLYSKNELDYSDLPSKRRKEIDFFGDTTYTNFIISIKAEMINESLENTTSWRSIIELLNVITTANRELREELSYSKFGKEYSQLNIHQKKAVASIYPLIIEIYPDFRFTQPLPPPEFKNLIELDTVETELEIEGLIN